MRYLACALIVATACTASTPRSSPLTTSAAPPAAETASARTLPPKTAPPSATVAPGVHRLDSIGGQAGVSPDGSWIGASSASGVSGKFRLFRNDGLFVREFELPTPIWDWSPDSSGLFVALDLPQRAPKLGLVDLVKGGVRDTGLEMAEVQLSRDGSWIIAEHQEGCCVGVTTPEIWVAPRAANRAPTTIARAANSRSLSLLGADARSGVVYRDGNEVRRVPIVGGSAQIVGTIAGPVAVKGSTSPDGLAIAVRGYEPAGWHIVANATTRPWDPGVGDIVELAVGRALLTGARPQWIGPHDLLVSVPTGLARVDTVTGARSPLSGALRQGEQVLAYAAPRLLIARGARVATIDLQTGADVDLGIDLGTDARAARGFALPQGGFIVSTVIETYRID